MHLRRIEDRMTNHTCPGCERRDAVLRAVLGVLADLDAMRTRISTMVDAVVGVLSSDDVNERPTLSDLPRDTERPPAEAELSAQGGRHIAEMIVDAVRSGAPDAGMAVAGVDEDEPSRAEDIVLVCKRCGGGTHEWECGLCGGPTVPSTTVKSMLTAESDHDAETH